VHGRSGWWILLPSGTTGRVNVQPIAAADLAGLIDDAVRQATAVR
jgi:hypothetical protein